MKLVEPEHQWRGLHRSGCKLVAASGDLGGLGAIADMPQSDR
ncbi:MAG TPA: hypothetical protein VN888_20810 [Mycobacterium sp.]|nr:hypothetical protein [Mycobacterium sp.]